MSGETSQYIIDDGQIELNAGRRTTVVSVANTGDRAIQVGSHFHFFEVNRALLFERADAFGMRLNIPAGTAVRFEPGEQKDVELVAIGGMRRILGLNALANGSLDVAGACERALSNLSSQGFSSMTQDDPQTTGS
jgi:urease beta subunit